MYETKHVSYQEDLMVVETVCASVWFILASASLTLHSLMYLTSYLETLEPINRKDNNIPINNDLKSFNIGESRDSFPSIHNNCDDVNESCSICLEPLQSEQRLFDTKCGHVFHKE